MGGLVVVKNFKFKKNSNEPFLRSRRVRDLSVFGRRRSGGHGGRGALRLVARPLAGSPEAGGRHEAGV